MFKYCLILNGIKLTNLTNVIFSDNNDFSLLKAELSYTKNNNKLYLKK
jgi:hypothetical protein